MSQNNTRNNNQKNQHPKPQHAPKPPQRDLAWTSTNLSPTAVTFNVMNIDIEEFILEFARDHGLEPLACRITSKRERGRELLHAYIFFDRNDEQFTSQFKNINPALRGRIADEGIGAGAKVSEFLRMFNNGDDVNLRTKGDTVMSQLDVFNCLGALLDAHPDRHNLQIDNIRTERSHNNQQNMVITVTKRFAPKNKSKRNNNNGVDRFTAMI